MAKRKQQAIRHEDGRLFVMPSVLEKTFERDFPSLYQDAMRLVDDYAIYMDVSIYQLDDRPEKIFLQKVMRLSALIMQCAGWLLLYRAFEEGDFSAVSLRREMEKIHIDWDEDNFLFLNDLTGKLQNFSERLCDIQMRILFLHRPLMALSEASFFVNPVQNQLQYLQSIFNRSV